jgi:hypothetical protein
MNSIGISCIVYFQKCSYAPFQEILTDVGGLGNHLFYACFFPSYSSNINFKLKRSVFIPFFVICGSVYVPCNESSVCETVCIENCASFPMLLNVITCYWIVVSMHANGRCSLSYSILMGFQTCVSTNYTYEYNIRGCIQKLPDWPPGARTANGTALWH